MKRLIDMVFRLFLGFQNLGIMAFNFLIRCQF